MWVFAVLSSVAGLDPILAMKLVCIVSLTSVILMYYSLFLACGAVKCCSANIMRIKGECWDKALTSSHGWKLTSFQYSLFAAPYIPLQLSV